MKITNLFNGARKRLIEQRAQAIEQNTQAAEQRLAEIEAAKLDPDYAAYLAALTLKVQTKIRQLEQAHHDAQAAEREKIAAIDAGISGAMDERVTAFLNWVENEKRRASREIVSRGVLDYGRAGIPQGRLVSNADKVTAYLKALDEAASEARLGIDLDSVRGEIPIFDPSPNRAELSAKRRICSALS
jgi:hypothetical protein